MFLRRLLAVAAALEAFAGLILLVDPSLLTNPLFGETTRGAGAELGRIAGAGLIALGLACWPGVEDPKVLGPAHRAMLAYNVLVTIYLIYVGIRGQSVGRFLWPASLLHAVMSFLLVREWPRARDDLTPRSLE